MAALPLVEIAARKTIGRGIPGSIPLVEHLTLWIAFLGAALAARTGRLLSLATNDFLPLQFQRWAQAFTGLVGAGVALWLARASFELIRVEFTSPNRVAMGIPVWLAMSIMPLALVCIGARLAWKGMESHWVWLWLGLGLLLTLGVSLPEMGQGTLLAGMLVIGLATLLGMPIFCAIGGLALLLFWVEGVPVAAVPLETYTLTNHPMLPAIPLFTLRGYILSEGGASRRLIRLFKALVGWIPGGLAIMTTGVLAFFTPLTGASGVTILSMGGLLLPVLKGSRYPEKFSIGLVTVSGSIGLLMPLSLPVILCAVTSNISVVKLFVASPAFS